MHVSCCVNAAAPLMVDPPFHTEPILVPHSSPQPTFNPSGRSGARDRVLLNRLSARAREYSRGDVVVLWAPTDPNRCIIKRLVGIEGDWVQTPGQTSGGESDGMLRVPKGACWVEGDNPSASTDSRAFGPVPLALIVARVDAIVWPPSRWGKVQTMPAKAGRVEPQEPL